MQLGLKADARGTYRFRPGRVGSCRAGCDEKSSAYKCSSPVSAPLIVASDIVAAVKEYPSNGFETESLLPVNAI